MPDDNAPSPAPGGSPAPDGHPAPDGSPEPDRAPDDRTTLANERTLLAWFRTSLALLVASFAVVRLTDITPRGLRVALGAYLNVLAVAMIAASYAQWRDRQLRISGPEPHGRRVGAPLLAVALLVLAGFIVAVTFLAP